MYRGHFLLKIFLLSFQDTLLQYDCITLASEPSIDFDSYVQFLQILLDDGGIAVFTPHIFFEQAPGPCSGSFVGGNSAGLPSRLPAFWKAMTIVILPVFLINIQASLRQRFHFSLKIRKQVAQRLPNSNQHALYNTCLPLAFSFSLPNNNHCKPAAIYGTVSPFPPHSLPAIAVANQRQYIARASPFSRIFTNMNIYSAKSPPAVMKKGVLKIFLKTHLILPPFLENAMRICCSRRDRQGFSPRFP